MEVGNGVEGGYEFVLGEYEKERMREAERDREEEKSRRFIGSVRKISLVGWDKRTKSGASLSRLEELAGLHQPRSSILPTPHLQNTRIAGGWTPQPKHFNTSTNPLFPPIKLHPPYPPNLYARQHDSSYGSMRLTVIARLL